MIKLRRMGEEGMHGQEEKCIYSFGGELQPNRPLERFTHRLESKFKMDLEEIKWKGTDRWQTLRTWYSAYRFHKMGVIS
jgi:hypothetical protein